MALQRGAGPRQLRVLVRHLQQILHDCPALGAVVAQQHGGGALMQFFDGRQPRQPERFARDHDGKRQRGGRGKNQSEKAEALAARKQILDQMGHANPVPSSTRPAIALQNIVPQRNPLPRRQHRRLDRDRQQRGIGFRRDVHRAAGRTARVIRIHHDHAGIVELEGRRPPVLGALAHCSLSPIRNWRARSRRM